MSGYGLAYSMRGYAGNRKVKRTGNPKGHHKGNPYYGCGPAAMPEPRKGPNTWERLLLDIGVSERDALALIGTATPEWARIKAWVRANGYKLFAPEEILSALGMGE